MKVVSSKFTGNDLACIIPTKDRPEKLKNLLASLAIQNEVIGRLIIVDGGKTAREVVMRFSDNLPVEYYECFPPGQIRQRNLALMKLDSRTPLVAFFDDDLVLKPQAIKEMIAFWNTVNPRTAGVSFNIVNSVPPTHTWFKGLVGLSGPIQGRVLRSGLNTSISSVPSNLKTQWLCGGATVWKLDILRKFKNPVRDSKWAIGEDLIFSYPIGKHYPLYVCAAAQVRHEHLYDHKLRNKYRYYGKTVVLSRLFFVKSNKELSIVLCLGSQFARLFSRLLFGVLKAEMRPVQLAIGQIEGIFSGILALLTFKDFSSLLNEPVRVCRKV